MGRWDNAKLERGWGAGAGGTTGDLLRKKARRVLCHLVILGSLCEYNHGDHLFSLPFVDSWNEYLFTEQLSHVKPCLYHWFPAVNKAGKGPAFVEWTSHYR